MNSLAIRFAVAGALLGSAAAMAQDYRLGDTPFTFRVAPSAPEWSLNAPEAQCRLRVFVDDKAQVQLRGDQVIVQTRSGRRAANTSRIVRHNPSKPTRTRAWCRSSRNLLSSRRG